MIYHISYTTPAKKNHILYYDGLPSLERWLRESFDLVSSVWEEPALPLSFFSPPPSQESWRRIFFLPLRASPHVCVGSRTLGTRCWADWISYKIRICIPKPGVIVWKRVTWQPVPTLLDPRPPPQTPVPMPSHMAPWAPQGRPSSPHPTPTWHNYGLLFRSRSSAPALVEGFKRSHSDRSPHTRPTSGRQAWR